MISSSQTLPDGYIQTVEINLAKNKGLAVLLNIVGLFISILTFALLVWFTSFVRPGSFTVLIGFRVDLSTIGQLVALILFVTLSLIVHELIHGFFFWFFTHSRPVYALHLAYAYAAAPGWYIPACLYWIIGLAPLVLIDAVGILLSILSPASWTLIIVFLVAFNTGGAVGDLWIAFHLFQVSPNCLVNDVGDGVTFYEPVKNWVEVKSE